MDRAEERIAFDMEAPISPTAPLARLKYPLPLAIVDEAPALIYVADDA
jgi:hypothetical protein